MTLFQIIAPYFTAGLEERQGRVHKAAPIVQYMKGRTMEWVRGYCEGKKWKLVQVEEPE